jgi:hypothetical protein
MRSHRYVEAIAELRRDLANNPNDLAAVEGMAEALRAKGDYGDALQFFVRLATHRKEDKVGNILAPGSDAWQIDIACVYWLLDDHSRATELMHGVANGILDGSIKYGDAAGGMAQGLLLYYMAITRNMPEEMSFALDYLRSRVKRSSVQNWPCPLARYYLGDIAFEAVMEAVNHPPFLPAVVNAAKAELGRRRRLTVALFHDGVRSRAQGNEEHCLARMRECYGLENPLFEQEWYLARFEVQKADNQIKAR